MANLVFSQGIEWGKIEQIPEGYHYVIDSNSNGDIIVGGFELNSDYAMQIYYKQDNQDWIEIPGNEQVAIMNGDVLITDTQNIYVCDFAMGLYGTNDLGNIWTGLAELTNEGCSAFNIHDSGTFFAGMTYTGIGFIHRSFDNGLSWESISLPDYNSNYPVEHIEFDSEGNIYLGTINGIYKSTDIGENWQKMNSGINGEHVSSIFIDDNDNIYIYTTYSAQSDGMYYSFDNAESWVGMPIPDYYVVDIVAQDDIILIIDGYNNIQLTEDLGNTWYISNEGLNDNSLYSLQLVQNNIIYAGGRYIHKSNSSIDECVDLSGLFFGLCDMALGVGYADGSCQYISGCGWEVDGMNYSDAFFESMDECEEACASGDMTCEEIESLYDMLHTGEYATCEFDNDCMAVWGDCSVGLGGCHYSVSVENYPDNEIDALVDLWLEGDCMSWVCDCSEEPYAQCVDGSCTSAYCMSDNPAGCDQTGCDEGYECVVVPGECVPSWCGCDVFYGDWFCTEDCGGGSCVESGLLGDLNGDGVINVMDIVLAVDAILHAEYDPMGDINGDGQLNVVDIVQLVNLILG